jgi:Zn-dependent protease with chaperone function
MPTTTSQVPYPQGPVSYNPAVLEPSVAFKRKVLSVFRSILLFLIVYLALIGAAILFTGLCVWLGGRIIAVKPGAFTLIIGFGLIAMAFMVLWFLLKFLFAVNKQDTSGFVEIKEIDQPKLFAFLRKLTEETGTHFPKRVFITPDVNASVFYNSSFWSIFLPIKKNLNIGLGLVNALNLSEFKAVMAHEFGHFSQRSMKLGSMVYQLNRIIYNMLFENTSYSRALDKLGSAHGILSITTTATVKIVLGIQWVLKKMYKVINKNYMELSREMEFHADTVAAAAAGGNHLISALRRIELADSAYSQVINQFNLWLEPTSNKKSVNLYPNQKSLISKLAHEFKMPIESDGLPSIPDRLDTSIIGSRVKFKDQWASHPERSQREEHLRSLQLDANTTYESAWSIFENSKALQESVTEKIYREVEFQDQPSLALDDDFDAAVAANKMRYQLPEIYNGYYDGRTIDPFSIEVVLSENDQLNETDYMQICTAENASIIRQIQANVDDLNTLKAIEEKQIEVQSFDFEGLKYESWQAAEIIKMLEGENLSLKKKLQSLDQQVFLQAYRSSGEKKRVIRDVYEHFFRSQRLYETNEEIVAEISQRFQPLLAGQQMSLENAAEMVRNFKEKEEPNLKTHLAQLLNENLLEISRDDAAAFIEKEYSYFAGDSFFDNELGDLFGLLGKLPTDLAEGVFLCYKTLLEQQEGILKHSSAVSISNH